MSNLCSLLNWLRDPFGTKRLTNKHSNIRRRMVETRTRAEDTTAFVRSVQPSQRLVRKNPVEERVLGNRMIRRKTAIEDDAQ